MRMTVNLSDEAYRIAKVYSVQKRISMSKAINELMVSPDSPQEGQATSPSPGSIYIHPLTGLPVSKCHRPITMEDIKRSEEEDDLRFLEGVRK